MRKAIDRIMSRVYPAAMKTATQKKPAPVAVFDLTGQIEYTVAVPSPAPDQTVMQRQAAAIERARESLGDRWLLHRKAHVRRLDGRDTAAPSVPYFLTARKGRVKVVK